MKAVAVTPGTRRSSLVELPLPTIATPTQVRVKVEEVGLCPLDRHIILASGGKAPPGDQRLIPGHEMVGRVVERGRDVSRLRLGDLVVATVRRGCSLCVHCLSERPDLCYTGMFTEKGIKEAHGYLAEYAVDEEAFLIPLPPALQEIGVLVEPLSRAVSALERARSLLRHLQPRCGHIEHAWAAPRWGGCKRALVVGSGATPLLLALLLLRAGAQTFLACWAPPSGALARLVGEAGGTFISLEEVPPRELVNWAGKVDLVLDGSERPSLPLELVRALDRHAAMVLLERPRGPTRLMVDGAALFREVGAGAQLLLGGISANRGHYEQAIHHLGELLEAFPSVVGGIITHRLPLAHYRQALALSGPEVVKAVVVI